ncbi:MAG: mechanosensitive ion channel [Nitrososphaeria archaeon]|nr:mechanosensitive ion channel [Nitrososphaeria archaeon]NIQ32329.1 mechanosensitive ion channel [Nitrososphaeria archaeon]
MAEEDLFGGILTFENIILIISTAILVAVLIIVDGLVRRTINRYSRRVGLEVHVENIFKFISRLIIAAVGIIVILRIFNIGVEWFVGLSALTGAAIGFASTQTLGNFLAGIYVMISRPFMVNDYVKIGNNEGQVTEITVNYTELFTPTYSKVKIPNRKILDSIITNFSKGDVFDYIFEVSFDHSVENKVLVEECIVPALEEFNEKHGDVMSGKPEFSMVSMDRLAKFYAIRVFFPERDINVFYDLTPKLLEDIAQRWDQKKKAA